MEMNHDEKDIWNVGRIVQRCSGDGDGDLSQALNLCLLRNIRLSEIDEQLAVQVQGYQRLGARNLQPPACAQLDVCVCAGDGHYAFNHTLPFASLREDRNQPTPLSYWRNRNAVDTFSLQCACLAAPCSFCRAR